MKIKLSLLISLFAVQAFASEGITTIEESNFSTGVKSAIVQEGEKYGKLGNQVVNAIKHKNLAYLKNAELPLSLQALKYGTALFLLYRAVKPEGKKNLGMLGKVLCSIGLTSWLPKFITSSPFIDTEINGFKKIVLAHEALERVSILEEQERAFSQLQRIFADPDIEANREELATIAKRKIELESLIERQMQGMA